MTATCASGWQTFYNCAIVTAAVAVASGRPQTLYIHLCTVFAVSSVFTCGATGLVAWVAAEAGAAFDHAWFLFQIDSLKMPSNCLLALYTHTTGYATTVCAFQLAV